MSKHVKTYQNPIMHKSVICFAFHIFHWPLSCMIFGGTTKVGFSRAAFDHPRVWRYLMRADLFAFRTSMFFKKSRQGMVSGQNVSQVFSSVQHSLPCPTWPPEVHTGSGSFLYRSNCLHQKKGGKIQTIPFWWHQTRNHPLPTGSTDILLDFLEERERARSLK